MTERQLSLGPGWWGWHELPIPHPGWGAGPVLVERVQPMKTGKGLLTLTFLQPMRPVVGVRRTVILCVLHRATTHLVGSFDDEGVARTAVVSVADPAWLKSFCPMLPLRMPLGTGSVITMPTGETWQYKPSVADLLAAAFGHEADTVLHGARPTSFGTARPPLPRKRGAFDFDRSYSAFDSWRIARGNVPAEMEDKWFVYLHEGRLLFRRSWTGFLIFDVAAAWRGDCLHLGKVRVNRNPEQYTETDDNHDRKLLEYLIDGVLLQREVEFPARPRE